MCTFQKQCHSKYITDHCEDMNNHEEIPGCFVSPKVNQSGSVAGCIPCSDAIVASALDCWISKERDMLLEMTRKLECHPEDYDGPCECQTCMSYAD